MSRYATIAGCVFSGLFGMLVRGGFRVVMPLRRQEQNEMQANGLESECKAQLPSIYKPGGGGISALETGAHPHACVQRRLKTYRGYSRTR